MADDELSKDKKKLEVEVEPSIGKDDEATTAEFPRDEALLKKTKALAAANEAAKEANRRFDAAVEEATAASRDAATASEDFREAKREYEASEIVTEVLSKLRRVGVAVVGEEREEEEEDEMELEGARAVVMMEARDWEAEARLRFFPSLERMVEARRRSSDAEEELEEAMGDLQWKREKEKEAMRDVMEATVERSLVERKQGV